METRVDVNAVINHYKILMVREADCFDMLVLYIFVDTKVVSTDTMFW